MKLDYVVKYRQPGQWFWRTIKKVIGDGVENNFRYVRTVDDKLIYFSLNAEVIFPPYRQKVIEHNMSKEAGQPVQRS